MNRRLFIEATLASVAAVNGVAQAADVAPSLHPTPLLPFKLKYAPHFGMFKEHAGADLVDQLSFAADEGFTAWEDNRLKERTPDVQAKIGAALERFGMTMGVFVAAGDAKSVSFASANPGAREKLLAEISASIDVARRVRAKWMTIVLGVYDAKLAWDFQTANVIENLRRCSEMLERHGLVMVMEPLNTLRNHPGVFLTKIPQAFMLCRAVNSPACKILFDLYHQQISEGNLTVNIDAAWSETAYYQAGDNPGRNEPGTGEVNFRHLFRHLHMKRYAGVVGMEHGNSLPGMAGERAVIDAYRAADSFR